MDTGIAEALEDLRWNWDGAYEITEALGVWRAVRRDNQVTLGQPPGGGVECDSGSWNACRAKRADVHVRSHKVRSDQAVSSGHAWPGIIRGRSRDSPSGFTEPLAT